MRVSVFGLGYVGSVSAASFAADGHDVIGVDVNPITRQLASLYFDAVRGRLPAYEDWLTPIY